MTFKIELREPVEISKIYNIISSKVSHTVGIKSDGTSIEYDDVSYISFLAIENVTIIYIHC